MSLQIQTLVNLDENNHNSWLKGDNVLSWKIFGFSRCRYVEVNSENQFCFYEPVVKL